jgi:hypothetical protein
VVLTVAGLVGCSSKPTESPSASASSGITGNVDDWRASVCSQGSYRDGPALGGYSFPNATAQGQCHSGTKQHFTGFVSIGQFNSESDMRNDLVAWRLFKYAATTGQVPITVFAIAKSPSADPTALDPLTQFGFTIDAV